MVPAAVTDLVGHQRGNEVILTFTLPKATADQQMLKQTPTIEIYKAVKASGAPSAQVKLVVTIPPAMTDQYFGEKGQLRYADKLSAEDFAKAASAEAVYVVRTRVSAKKESEDSNPVAVAIWPAPEAIADLTATFSRAGVALRWTPPQKTVTGTNAAIFEYHVYRAEEQKQADTANGEKPKWKAPPAQIGTPNTPDFLDANADFGRVYGYTVRSVMKNGEALLEAADSNEVLVTTKDVFPPQVPQGLVVVLVPAQGETPAHLELSWEINPETDLTGYNVYRSEQIDATGTRQNAELLRTPAFRDMNAVPGRRYFYRVTAVDSSGNESAASAAGSGELPGDSQ